MANALTGDFDVVAEFAVPAANRVLAAMHRNERFLHSISVAVNDNPPPGPRFPGPIVVGSVDAFGDAVANQRRIGNPNPFPGASAATNPISAALDAVVNIDQASAFFPPIVPSHLSGKAQLQLFPPTVGVPDSTGTNLSVSLQLLSRYFPDPHTSPLAEFIRGEVQITAAVSQVASQVGNTLDIDFKADSAVINFTPAWSSQPLSADDLAGINLMLRNGLRTSFLPSNVALPSNVSAIRFRTLAGAQSALAILLNMTGPAGNPASMNDVFLGAGDDFAFAVGVDYIRSVLQPTINNILSQSYSIVIPIDVYFATYHVSYVVTLSSVTVNLQNGQIVLATQGKATQTSNKWYAPDNFTFTAQLSFTLQVDGDTADLVPGDVSLNTSSWVVNLFQGAATDGMKNVRDQALAQKDANGLDTYDKVKQMLSATGNLGGLLSSLLATARTPIRRIPIRFFPGYKLAYTSVAIQPAGIVLHGSLSVTDWPPAYVEFEQIPATTDGSGPVNAGDLLGHGPDFSALKSWIPGGTIQQYEWSTQGQPQPFLIDPNKFVLIHSQTSVAAETATVGAVAAYAPLCLTVRGTRLSSSGPVVAQPVVGMVCGFNSFPVVSGLNVSQEAEPLLLALALSSSRGRLVVTGHTTAQLGQAGSGSANRLVHFASDKTAGSLEFLPQALAESKRTDAVTAVLAVLTSDQLSKASYAAGVIYAEDRDGAWEAAFRVKTAQRPLTLIVGPKGNILWQQEGDLDSATLAAALAKFLVREASVKLGVLRSNLRIGQPVPNFLLGTADGQVTLRKLIGRPCTLVFWRSSLKPSMDAVRDMQEAAAKAGVQGPVVLAINDGEAADVAAKAAADNGLTAVLVTDPEREISFACGVNAWPTTIFTDPAGLVTAIRCGRFAGDAVGTPSN
jgi:peroxiredoxin